jgi:hypothetical protein
MTMNESTALDVLAKAAAGLLFLSETDAPLVPFFWPSEDDAALTPARLLELAKAKPDAPVKTATLAHFFRNAIKEKSWHNEEEKAEVEKFKSLVATLKSTLKKPQVFRVGEVSIDVYVVGVVEGGYAGLQTRVVET